jgi:hypothetical protein
VWDQGGLDLGHGDFSGAKRAAHILVQRFSVRQQSFLIS